MEINRYDFVTNMYGEMKIEEYGFSTIWEMENLHKIEVLEA